ncbi:hypothetical protein A0H76_2484 [Hepatospora eriocheir]|uniref:Uncharacterized protein n=1 Tax=Hepatospora eriocheir TaxID=1081669 RepID=A0A1X0QJR2_9MICR|nr:hypothetical protein A0H76_2484 [Hepatospora eriocheir]
MILIFLKLIACVDNEIINVKNEISSVNNNNTNEVLIENNTILSKTEDELEDEIKEKQLNVKKNKKGSFFKIYRILFLNYTVII